MTPSLIKSHTQYAFIAYPVLSILRGSQCLIDRVKVCDVECVVERKCESVSEVEESRSVVEVNEACVGEEWVV
jgi:hypothetical protein